MEMDIKDRLVASQALLTALKGIREQLREKQEGAEWARGMLAAAKIIHAKTKELGVTEQIEETQG